MEDDFLSKNVEENLNEIIDYIMLRLYRIIASYKEPSSREIEVGT